VSCYYIQSRQNLQPILNGIPGPPEEVQAEPQKLPALGNGNARMSHWFQTKMFVVGLLPHLQQGVHVQVYTTLQEAYKATIKVERLACESCLNQLLQLITIIKPEYQQQEEA
jgi:hypothetical protein